MKQFKKLASLLLAAVLAMTLLAGCGGRGGNVGTAVTEQSLLKCINEARANADRGLSPVKNDPILANAAAKLLKAFSETEMVKTSYGTGYKLTKTQAENILQQVTGKTGQKIDGCEGMVTGSFFYVAPRYTYYNGYNDPSLTADDIVLFRRANKAVESTGYSYGGTIYDFGTYNAVMARDMKVGIAFREINGERFALVVYDVTFTPTTPAP